MADERKKRWLPGPGQALAYLILITFVIAPFESARAMMGGAAAFAGIYALEILAAVFIHEFGHAAAAGILKWRVHLIAIGPIGYHPDRKSFSLKLNRARVDLLGSVSAWPREGKPQIASRAFVAAAGPAANLLAAMVMLGIISKVEMVSKGEALMGSFGIVSLGLALANLVPFKCLSGEKSDGAMIVEFLRQRAKRLISSARRSLEP